MYDAPSYADWVGRYLGPKLRASHPTVKIMAWDYNRLSDAVPFANALVSGGYSRYVDVVAWHWYNMPGNLGLNYVAQVEAIFPGVPQLATESCYLQGLTETWSTGAELMGLDALADVNWVRVCWRAGGGLQTGRSVAARAPRTVIVLFGARLYPSPPRFP